MKTLALLLAVIPAIAAADVTVDKTDYAAWKGCYRIGNGVAEVIVSPQMGRVVRYGYAGKPNFIWEGSAARLGGDHISVNDAADPDFDGSAPWTVEQIPNGIRLTSPTSRSIKARVVREITMANGGTTVHFRNRLENQGAARTFDFAQVTAADDPYSIYLPTERVGQNPNGWRMILGSDLNPAYHKKAVQGLQIARHPSIGYRIGAFSTLGEIQSSKGTIVFHVKTRVFRGIGYPAGSPLQVATYPNPDRTADLIVASPTAKLQPSENAVLEIDWQLTDAK